MLIATSKTVLGDIVLRYKFDEGLDGQVAASPSSIIDSSGNGFHGTPFGGPIYRQLGTIKAMQFDGQNDRIFVPDAPKLAITTNLVLETTLRLDSLTGSIQQIVFYGDDRAGLDPYQLSLLSDGRIQFRILRGTGGVANVAAVVSPTPIAIGQFHHIVGSLDDLNSLMTLHIDGQLVSSILTDIRPLGVLDPTLNPGIGIGSRQTGGADFFHGLIDEVTIYDSLIAVPEPASSTMLLMAIAMMASRKFLSTKRKRGI